jgi:hypothetical protein
VGRDGNKAAHCLAKLVVFQFCQHVWVDVCPSVVLDIVSSEQAQWKDKLSLQKKKKKNYVLNFIILFAR